MEEVREHFGECDKERKTRCVVVGSINVCADVAYLCPSEFGQMVCRAQCEVVCALRFVHADLERKYKRERW